MEALKIPSPYEWGVSSVIYKGETNSGDKSVVLRFKGGTLAAVIDALGHGDEAAYTAGVAAGILEQYAHENLPALVERCHAKLRIAVTRGATMSIAAFDWQKQTMTWLGIGNVAGMLFNVNSGAEWIATSLLVRSGLVGDRLPNLQPCILPFTENSTLIMTTDGVSEDYSNIFSPALSPQHQAKCILEKYARHDDDATVLVFRGEGYC